MHAAGKVEQARGCGLFQHARAVSLGSRQAAIACLTHTTSAAGCFCLPCDIKTLCLRLVSAVLCWVG